MGAPYVPTKKKELLHFLGEAGIKKGDVFIELGCGDGRVVRTAVEAYHAKGLGVDINPMLIYWARFKARMSHLTTIEFRIENILKTDISQADFVYLFLMPELVKKISDRLKKQAKKTAVIISHGFKVEGWEKYLYKTIDHKPFPTYYYKFK